MKFTYSFIERIKNIISYNVSPDNFIVIFEKEINLYSYNITLTIQISAQFSCARNKTIAIYVKTLTNDNIAFISVKDGADKMTETRHVQKYTADVG